MFTRQELESVIMLTYLKDRMLDKIERITHVETYPAGAFIFKEGDFAEYLYAIIEGTVSLELEQHANQIIRIKNITPRYTFGISSMVDTDPKACTSHARAVTDTRVFRWNASELEKLFYQDFELGFIFMKRIAKILRGRLLTIEAQIAGTY